MGILTKEVEIRPTGKSIQYYRDKGYDAAHLKPIMVKVEDLPEHSDRVVEILCDYCKENVVNVKYSAYKNGTKNIEKYACKNCRYEKIKDVFKNLYNTECPLSLQEVRDKSEQTMMKKYGVSHYSKTEEAKERNRNISLEKHGYDNPMKNPLIKEKVKNTNLQKFGFEYNLQSPDIREQIKETCILKYGFQNVSQVPEIQEKRKNTILSYYGVENPFQIPEAKEKAKQTLIAHYGVESPQLSSEIRERTKNTNLERYGGISPANSLEVRTKMAQTLYKNSSTPTSKQQLYIFNLYKSVNDLIELNYSISYYNADICLLDEKIDVEIDLGGHNLSVKLGRLTQEEFNQKEIIRNNVIKREGYKQMRIISSKDLLPSDTILLQMLQDARTYFSLYPNHSWIEFNIDTSTVRNAESQQGSPYNFGVLRTIKDSDLNAIQTI